MPTVLHIDGPPAWATERGTFATQPGETLKEVFDRMGVSYSLERIPDGPRTGRRLSREAAEFIRTYEREDPSAVLAVFWRCHSLKVEEFDTAEQAKRFIESGEEYDSLAGEAIVDGDKIEVWD